MSRKAHLPPVPLALADVALIDGPAAAAAGSISLSQWHDLVRRREAPQPVVRESRCTRWRLIDVRAWLVSRAGQADTHSAGLLIARAKKASIKAREPEAIAKAAATRAAKKAATTAAIS